EQYRDHPCFRRRRSGGLGQNPQEPLRNAVDGDFPMSQAILDWSLFLAQIMLAMGLLAALVRMARGPRAQDRILALDALYVVALLLLVTLGIRNDSQTYFELALLMALLGFVGTLALAKFLMRGEVIE